jgi:micrococcal nuclease
MVATINVNRGPWLRFTALGVLAVGLSGLVAPTGLRMGDGPTRSAAAEAPQIPCKDFRDAPECVVVRVVTGDTLILKAGDESRRVGLLGAAAPPLSQPLGHEARQYLENLLAGEAVYVEYPPGSTEADRFGRYPAYVYRAPDGLWLNLEVVRQGFGRVDAETSFEHRALFEFFEKRAREHQKGLWAPVGGRTAQSQPAAEATGRRSESQPAANGDDVTVYVTASGKKYHRATCQHARTNATPITLKDAKARGYEPCSRCKPPK